MPDMTLHFLDWRRLRLFLLGRQVDPGIRLDPAHVVVDLGHAGRVFGDDPEAGAQPFIGDRAAEGDDAVPDLDPDARAGRPAGCRISRT